MVTKDEFDRKYDDLIAHVRENGGKIELKTRVRQVPFFVRLHKDNAHELVARSQKNNHLANLTRELLFDVANDNKNTLTTMPHRLPYFGSILEEMGMEYPIPLARGARKKILSRICRDKNRLENYAKNLEIGREGEYLALSIVREKWDEKEYTIEHVAEHDDSAGYDIRVTKNGNIVAAIEVKSTLGGRDTPFFLTEHERETSKKIEANCGKYHIYRLYNLGSKDKENYIVIDSNTLDGAYVCEPQTVYHVSPKN